MPRPASLFQRFWFKDANSDLAAAKSIAVLPFENLSENRENSYFVDGMQDEVITRLAKIGDLRVISRSSTQRYKTQSGNLAEIARELGVSHLVKERCKGWATGCGSMCSSSAR